MFTTYLIFNSAVAQTTLSIPKDGEGQDTKEESGIKTTEKKIKARADKTIKIVVPGSNTDLESLKKDNILIAGVEEEKAPQIKIHGNELADCKKEDDGRKISCPDGEYIKSSSVVDSIREEIIKNEVPVNGKIKIKNHLANPQ